MNRAAIGRVLRGALTLGALAAPVRAEPDAPRSRELAFGEVLNSVRAHHPDILIAGTALRAAEAQSYSARGEFDPLLRVEARAAVSGYYDPKRLDVVVDQATPVLGASLYAGYRLGRGEIAPYYGEQNTLAAGELRAGVRVPVLAQRRTDERRTGIALTRANERASDAAFEGRLLDTERDAAARYFGWVAAGARLRVYERLLLLASEREALVRAKVELGALPALELVDNQRTILERERQRVAAERARDRASLELSLYLRDARGAPRVVSPERLPAELASTSFVLPSQAQLAPHALAQLPELSRMRAEVDSARAEQELARERVLPRLDLIGDVSRDLRGRRGEDPTLAPTTLEVGASFSLPLGLRRERGRLRAAEQKLEGARLKAQFSADKALVELRDARAQLEATRTRLELAKRACTLADELAQGERERFLLGATTILFVNVREQASADAELSVVDTWLEQQVALARVLVAAGTPLDPLAAR